jgi:gluconokinase
LQHRLTCRPGHYMPASLLGSQLAALERPGPGERALQLDSRLPPERLAEAAQRWAHDTLLAS